jgi:hypothetical protein
MALRRSFRLLSFRHHPCYGAGQRDSWEQITGVTFDSNGLCRIGKTVAVIAPHPVTRGLGNEYWLTMGRSLRKATRRITTYL